LLPVTAGFAGATGAGGVEDVAEERMSVSAALQRFRRMERLSKEQRDLTEQQLAILEAQRMSALSHRASHSGGSGSPVVRQPCTRKDVWTHAMGCTAHERLCLPASGCRLSGFN